MYLSSVVLTAAAVLTSVQASPFLDLVGKSYSALSARDLESTSCVDFTYGNTDIKINQVCVTISGGTLTIKYPTLPGGQVYTDVHAIAQVGAIEETNQAKWPLTKGNGKCTITNGGKDASCSTPVIDAWRYCGKTLNIAAHASFGVPGADGETGWGFGPCIPGGRKGNCPKSFTIVTECKCPSVTTYDPYTTSIEYVVTKTIYETLTTTCSGQKGPATATETCANAYAGIVTVSGGAVAPAGFTCSTPPPPPPPACTN